MRLKKAMAAVLSATVLATFTACRGDMQTTTYDFNLPDNFSEVKTGSGESVKQDISLEDGVYEFSIGYINYSGSDIKVEIDPYAEESYIERDENLVDDVTLSIDEESKTIVLEGKSGVMYDNLNCKIKLAAKVASVEIKGDVFVDYTVPHGVEDVRISAGGTCVVEAKGVCTSGLYTLTGDARLYASDVITDRSKVNVSGTSMAEVFAKNALDANATGSSTIIYHGSPSSTIKTASGRSTIIER